MQPRRRRIGRWGLAIAVTLIVHGGILLPWLLTQGPPGPPLTPPVELALLHPQQPRPEVQPVSPRSAGASSAAPIAGSDQATPSTALATQAEPSSQPAATTPSDSPSGAAGPAGPAVLNLACLGNLKRLSADQRRQCEDKQWAGIGRHDPSDSGLVPPPLIDPNKAAFYDAVLAAKHSPGHGPGFGCGKAISWGEGGSKMSRLLKKKRLAKEAPVEPPHSLKLGPLPCYITPPQGFLTPEADVPPRETFKDGHAPALPTFVQPIYRGQGSGPGG